MAAPAAIVAAATELAPEDVVSASVFEGAERVASKLNVRLFSFEKIRPLNALCGHCSFFS